MPKANRKNVVEQIYNWRDGLLRSKLAMKIDQGETLEQLKDFVTEYTDGKIDPSISTVNNYKAKYKEAVKSHIDMGELLDLRRKTGDNIVELRDKEHVSKVLVDDNFGNNNVYAPKREKLTSTLEVLEKYYFLRERHLTRN